jgi:hypothetical protein
VRKTDNESTTTTVELNGWQQLHGERLAQLGLVLGRLVVGALARHQWLSELVFKSNK